jgi:CBS domain-containing protein
MARYGRDYGRDRWSGGGGYGQGGYGAGQQGGGMNRGRYGGEYGGMGSDASYGGGSQAYGGHSGFGSGGGAYDNDFNASSYGGYGGGTQNYVGYGGGWTGGLSNGGDMDRSGASQGGGEELRRMRAADVMTDNPECVTPETSLADAARKMRDLDVGIIPVVESETSKRLRGVLTDRDIAIRAVAEGKDANATRVMEVMTTQVETCNKNDSLRDVLAVMEREQVRRVPITDREGRLVGIIAQADVATEVDTPQGQRRFAETVSDISEPGNPRGRGGWTGGGRASQGRGGSGGGVMGAVRNAVSSLGGGEPSRTGGSAQRTGGMASGGSTQGNNDPRAINDPGSENV